VADPAQCADASAKRVDELIRATEDPQWRKRWDAVNALGDLKDLRGIPVLAKRALYDDNPHSLWRSLWALSSVDRQATQAVPEFLAALECEDPVVVHNAAVALAFFGRAESRPALLRALDHPDEYQRWEAVFSFRKVGNAEVAAVLVGHLDPSLEPSTRVRGESALVLGRILKDDAVPTLLKPLREDPSRDVRWRAALALSRLNVGDSLGDLKGILAAEKDAEVRKLIQKRIEKSSN
jgi:HEAT repeat protein